MVADGIYPKVSREIKKGRKEDFSNHRPVHVGFVVAKSKEWEV